MSAALAARPRALRTRVCDLFGVEHPIVQTGMGWVAGPRLVVATARAGGLGILASATMTLEELEAAVAEVKERTDRPFGVNLRADQGDVDARLEVLVRERVRVASFVGPPSAARVARLKQGGVVTVVTVGARRHAEKMAALGVDVLIAQGGEGGGHTGAIPTTLLLPEVVRAVSCPVLGAGGFQDGRGLVAALAFGADGIAMGTRFLLTRDSTVPDAVKARYLEATLDGTVVTRRIDGQPQRVIRTPFIDRLERAGRLGALVRALRHLVAFRRLTGEPLWALLREGLAMKRATGLPWSDLALAPSAPVLTRAALVEGRPEAGVLPAGQVAGAITELPSVGELVERIMTEAAEVLARLAPERIAHG